MTFYEAINSVLNPMMGPLLSLNPLLAIILISLILSVIITIVYKYMTDQELMKTLKEDIKAMQNEMKLLKNNPPKMMEIQKRAMEKNMKYMMHSMKPTLVTFIPLILVFGWLSANFAYSPILPGEKFSTYVFMEGGNTSQNATIVLPEGLNLLSGESTGINKIDGSDNPDNLPFKNKDITSGKNGGILKKGEDVYFAGWELSGKAGEYIIEYHVDGQQYAKNALISGTRYTKPIEKIGDGIAKGILIDQEKLIVMNLFGWKLGWLGTYIICSLVFSMGLRKILKIH